MTPTVYEPVREDDEHDALALVPCWACDGNRVVQRERRDGTVIRKRCRECKGNHDGTILQGNPPGERYGLTLPSASTVYTGHGIEART